MIILQKQRYSFYFLFKPIMVLFLASLLAACAPKTPLTAQQTLIEELHNLRVEVVTVGETVTIALPSDALFKDDSANPTSYLSTSLEKLAALLRTYRLTSVKVDAYSNWPVPNVKALSQKQAEVVSETLWNYGIDTRLLTAKGWGSGYPVVKRESFGSSSSNRRIVISFRYYPAVSYYD